MFKSKRSALKAYIKITQTQQVTFRNICVCTHACNNKENESFEGNRRDVWEGSEGGKRRERMCNYIIIII